MGVCYQGGTAKKKKTKQNKAKKKNNNNKTKESGVMFSIFSRCTSFSSNVNLRMNESHAHKQVYFHLSPALGSSHVK